jgi:hypothetical protein
VECAKALGTKVLKDGGGTDKERIEYAFRRCTGRTPSTGEQAVLSDFLSAQKKRLAENAEAAKPLGDTAEAAAWTALARVLLNLDETITKE